jgi:hypothetical protein
MRSPYAAVIRSIARCSLGLLALLPWSARAADLSAVVAVDDRTQLKAGAVAPAPVAGHFQQRIQVRNLSPDVLSGPLILAFKKVSPQGLTLVNGAGTLDDGTPYVEIPLKQGQLKPDKVSPKFNLEFSGSASAVIGYAGRVYAVLPEGANRPPVANAGPPRLLAVGSPLQLDGSASSDRDGGPLTYRWKLTKKPRKSRVSLSAEDSVNSQFTPDQAGVYGLQLEVTDSASARSGAKMLFSTRAAAPVAVAGADQTVAVGATVNLEQQSYDPDGGSLTYSWSLKGKPKGSKARLGGARTATPSLVPDVPGGYLVSLVVTDNDRLKSLQDTVVIDTVNSMPLAVATADPTGTVSVPVNLSAAQSSDADGDTLSYRWSLLTAPAGSAATIAGPDQPAANLTPDQNGTYVFQLIADDGIAQSLPVTAKTVVGGGGSGNRAPRISPVGTSARRATVGQLYDLDVDATDADGDSITFSLDEAPTGMTIDATTGAILWTPAEAGTVRATVRASDGELSDTLRLTIRVSAN